VPGQGGRRVLQHVGQLERPAHRAVRGGGRQQRGGVVVEQAAAVPGDRGATRRGFGGGVGGSRGHGGPGDVEGVGGHRQPGQPGQPQPAAAWAPRAGGIEQAGQDVAGLRRLAATFGQHRAGDDQMLGMVGGHPGCDRLVGHRGDVGSGGALLVPVRADQRRQPVQDQPVYRRDRKGAVGQRFQLGQRLVDPVGYYDPVGGAWAPFRAASTPLATRVAVTARGKPA